MSSELRRALLKAPSTSASAALVRPLNPKPRNAEGCTTNAEFPFYSIYPDLFPSAFKYTELRTLDRGAERETAGNRIGFSMSQFLHEHGSGVQSGVYGEERGRGC